MLPVLPVPRAFEAGGTLGVLGLAVRAYAPLAQPVLSPPRNFAGASDDVSRLLTQQLLARRAARSLSSMTLADSSSSSSGVTAGQLKGFINGLNLTWSTTTAVIVAAGVCRDDADAAFVALAAAVTVDYATKDAIQGLVRKSLTGTAAATTANATVTGTGTAFLTEFGTRTGTGTIAGAGTTITGTGTKFLSEVAINDLIGTNAKGYSRVTAIASDTSLTIAAAIPGGDPGGVAPVVIEQPTITVGTNTTQQVKTITSDTSLATVANGSAIVSGVAAKAGEVPLTPSVTAFLNCWLVSGASGTGCIFSTQRTTPFTLTGFTTSKRRIGAFPLSSAGLILAFTQSGAGNSRYFVFQFANNTNSNRLLASGASTTWTPVTGANVLAPPSAPVIYLTILNEGPTAICAVGVRARNVNSGDAGTPRAVNSRSGVGGRTSNTVYADCDNSQALDYVISTPGGGCGFLDMAGYVETI